MSRTGYVILFLSLLVFLPACTSVYTLEDYPDLDRMAALPPDIEKRFPITDNYPPLLHSTEYEEPIPLPGAVNTAGGEDSPFILPDGQTLYFFFTPDVRVPHSEQISGGLTGIYVSQKTGNTWGEPERVWLAPPGVLAMDGAVSIQGDQLWFASVREGFPGVQVFTAEWGDGRWMNWQPVGDRLMKEIQIGEVHPHGEDLYFHSDRPGGLGDYDIWKTSRINDDWSDPVNITAVNTEGMEGWPCLSPDGNELWFTRTHNGTPAIYRSLKTEAGWSKPELIVSQFAGEPAVDSAGNLFFVHHYYENGVMIEADIYVTYKK